MSVYINPYTDFGFKKLFGEEANKALLIDFLNSILPAHHQIAYLSFQNVENLPDTEKERKAFFDIHCKSITGERFIVEMQKAPIRFFKERSLYYVTFPIRDQAQRGEWNFELSAIYFIAILDFFYEENEGNAKFYRCIELKDQDHEVFYNKLQLHYLQMPAFKKKAEELESHFDKWAFFLKHLETFDNIPQILNEPIFEYAFDTAMLANLDREQLNQYEFSRLSYIGMREVIKSAEERGIEKGLAEGIEKGLAEARAQALIAAQKSVIALYNNGVPIAVIAISVGKTEAEVRAIVEASH